ncbi:helix-turn-helix domain-containing protein [Paraburkholderia saeva]|uniref:Rha family transcriptional regulator n=1 Tax=Paraburkholderia saeva TaxID=2777537 RepID=A0A9N8RX57_9BURK|nr:helix-turn-helix domain-containing protein [Paraburkholderia saeva]CAG4900591.1 hypothetical protein LMG31841_02895 [Paraburkholderia saeva]
MDQFANTVIDRLGGTSAVARICECKPPSVHQWRTDGIPKPRLQFLRIAYPQAFEDLEEPTKAEQPAAA